MAAYVPQGDLEIQVNARLTSKGLNFAACLWRSSCSAVRGFKTFISCGALGLIGLYDEVGGGDLITEMKNQFGADAKLGRWIIGVAFFFTLLRIATKTRPGGGVAAPNDEGDTIH